MAHCFVLGGVGLHLAAIQCLMAQPDHEGLLAKPQDLNEQLIESVEIAAPVSEQLQKVVRGRDQLPFTIDLFQAPQQEAPQAQAVVRLLIPCQHPEGQILVAGPLDRVPLARWLTAR